MRMLLLLIVVLAAVGCKSETTPAVNVKGGPDGANVSAPGVKIEAGSGGAKVEVNK